jgi:hypothetical protein
MIFDCNFLAGYATNGNHMLTVVISGAEERATAAPATTGIYRN